MKITAGLGSIDEYVRFVRAGADEFFCGYVPYSWTKKYGTVMPLNRREVVCYNVQLGAFSELEMLAAMVKKYKKPVHLTFNSLYYIPEQYPEIGKIVRECMALGFESYIIADPALILYLRQKGINCEIHLSGETGEVNCGMVELFQRFDLKRIIFHRKNTFEDMRAVITGEKLAGRDRTEFEAFILNEMCQFTGAFCNSLHCDEMGYLCRVPYWPGAVKDREKAERCGGKTGYAEMTGEKLPERAEKDDGLTGESLGVPHEREISDDTEVPCDEDGYLCGASGCGLCALYQLQSAGITHLKLVGRGNYADYMEKDIRNLRQALTILESSHSEKEFQKKMKHAIFPAGCSGMCYY